MATLSRRRRDDVYASISIALQESLDELADTSRRPMLSQDRISEVVDSLKDVFDNAVRDVLTNWDAARLDVDFLEVLPAELSSACFRLLPLRDCISVSHVSRAWRRAVLDDRGLWAEYSVPRTLRGVQSAPEALETLLRRSHPLPFHFEYGNNDSEGGIISSAIYDLVLAYLDRMAKLLLDDPAFVARLMRLDASLPLLHRLELHSAGRGKFYEFPAQWGAQKASRLEHLKVWGLALPMSCQPFAALCTLWALLPAGHIAAVSFSELFPRLETLHLHGVTAATLPMLTPLPAALEVAMLTTNNAVQDPIDYSRFFRGVRVPCALRQFTVDCAAGFLDALELFLRVCDGRWKLEIGDGYATFRDLARADVEWTVRVLTDDPLRLETERGGAVLAHLQRLAELRMPLPEFAALHTGAGWARALPCLRALVLDLDDFDDTPTLESLGGAGVPTDGISMPELDYVEFMCAWIGRLQEWLAGPAAGLLSALLAGRGKESISTVYVRSYGCPRLSRDDVAPLLLLASRVLIGTTDDPQDAQLKFSRHDL